MRINEKPLDGISAAEAKRGRSIAGMIICVRPDGWKWGTKETWPDFAVIRIPGVAVAECEKYQTPEYSDENATNKLRYRAWQINLTNIPSVFRTVLTNGTLSITGTGPRRWSLIRTNFLLISSGQVETNNLTFP